MNLVSWVLGVRQSHEAGCRWCGQPIGEVRHAPIPVCQRCFDAAYAPQGDDRGWYCSMCYERTLATPGKHARRSCGHGPQEFPVSGWTKLLTDFRVEAEQWVKRLQRKPDAAEMAIASTEAQLDLVSMQIQVRKLAEAGRTEEAQSLQKQFEARSKALREYKIRTPEVVRALEREEQ